MTDLLVVGLATSLDRYVWIDRLRIGAVNRPLRVEEQAGGKALHLARAAATLGATVHAVVTCGGRTGERVRELADDAPWSTSWIPVASATRICTSVIDTADDTMTEFYEPVAPLAASDWDPIVEAVREAAERRPDVAVVAGQLPDGPPRDGFASLVRLIAATGVPVFVDSTGPALAAALDAGPEVVKVTVSEAADALGLAPDECHDAHEVAAALVSRGAAHAVITRGSRGAVYATADREPLTVSAPTVDPAWPVGRGDSFMAGLAVARANLLPWDVALQQAAGAAAANAMHPVAAGFTRESATEYAAEASVTPRQAGFGY